MSAPLYLLLLIFDCRQGDAEENRPHLHRIHSWKKLSNILDICLTATNEQFLTKVLPQTVRTLLRKVSFVGLCSAKSSQCAAGFKGAVSFNTGYRGARMLKTNGKVFLPHSLY